MGKTLNDLIDVAIQHEIASQELYKFALNIVKDKDARIFLNELVEEEKGHQTMLESIKEMELYDGSTVLDDASILEYGASTHNTEDLFNSETKIENVLNIALKREFHAKSIFEKMSAITSNKELKTIFIKLAEEEDIHHQNISKKFSLKQGEMGYEM